MKPRKQPSVEYVTHIIRVKAWDFYYSRRATDPKSKWERGPISELATLSLVGEVVRPENCKYKDGKLTFSGRVDHLDPQPGPSLVPIGSATARDDEIEGYVSVPDERLTFLLTAAQSGQIEVVHFTGPKLRYGNGVIHSVSVDTRFDEDEW